jgi:hypothetical protein
MGLSEEMMFLLPLLVVVMVAAGSSKAGEGGGEAILGKGAASSTFRLDILLHVEVLLICHA